jgi:hypothetical protein
VTPDEQRVAQRLDTLITAGHFQTAGRIANKYISALRQGRYKTPTSAHTWFKLALIARLIGSGVAANNYWCMARKMDDYNDTLAGDFLRDQMLAAIRKGQLETAESFVTQIRTLHAGDTNRLAALRMAEARLAFAHGDISLALRRHTEADAMWRALEAPNQQWMRNNRFHWFKPVVAAGADRTVLYGKIIADEPRGDRKVRVQVMYRLGRPGLWIDRIIEGLFF